MSDAEIPTVRQVVAFYVRRIKAEAARLDENEMPNYLKQLQETLDAVENLNFIGHKPR